MHLDNRRAVDIIFSNFQKFSNLEKDFGAGVAQRKRDDKINGKPKDPRFDFQPG
jgi:hypothetical protein